MGGAIGAWLDRWLAGQMPVEAQTAVLAAVSLLAVGLAGSFAVSGLITGVRRMALACSRAVWWSAALAWKVVRWLLRRRLRLPGWRKSAPAAPAEERPAADLPPGPPATGIVLPQDIPILHHGVNLLPDASARESRSFRSARLSLSNGLQSERQRFADYELPPLHLLEDPRPIAHADQEQHLREQAVLLEKTVRDFGLNVKVVGINTGPVITMYEVSLETGLRVHKVTTLADDLALNLKVPSVRMVAPIPGKNAVGIEIPNEHRGRWCASRK